MPRRFRWWMILLCGYAATSVGIEAPKTQIAPAPAPVESPSIAFTPSDESAFESTLQRVAQRRTLIGLKVAPDVIDALARGDVDVAIATLSTQASAGKSDANIAMVRLQHWCSRIVNSRPGDPRAQVSKLGANVSAERLNRIAGVLVAEEQYRERARGGCNKAEFDFGAIESRLRAAAQAGDPPSATELAQFVRDAQQRESLLQSASDKNFAPATYALATSRLMAVQRGETTENVASIRLLLKQAGRSMPKAKIDLANCMATGCDGHPADTASAQAFGLDAARDGEPTAFASIVQMPWARRLTRTQMLSWQYFGDRLNEAGCTGDGYVGSAVAFDRTIKALEKSQSATLLDQAKNEADALWNANGERARKEQGCS